MRRSLSIAVLATALCSSVLAQAPVNDDCSGAIPVGLGANPGGCGTFSNAMASTSAGYAPICTTISSDVWYSFTPTTSGAYTIDTNTPTGCTAGTETDTVVAVYTSCGAATPIACDDDAGTGLLSMVSTGLCANQTYFIRVGSFGSQSATNSGTFYLNINPDTVNFTQIICSTPGCVTLNLVNGIPNGTYYFAPTTTIGTFPNGWFFGIDITLQEINNQLNSGFPFVGNFDAAGNFTLGPICGLPSGFTFCSVALAFTSGLGIPQNVTAPICTTIL
jgi:hypothetical protein